MKNKYDFIVAVSGSPNVGKSTLFNIITGERQHVGNWPGKTVERYEGLLIHHGYRIKIVDLPGTYSLGALSEEEVIARDFIVKEKPDVVIVIADALRLEHTLYLVVQLLELTGKVVVALNKMDAADKRGIHIHVDRLSRKLSVPVVPVSALHNIGINNLIDRVLDVAKGRVKPGKFKINYNGIEYYIGKVEEILRNNNSIPDYPPRWVAIRLLEGDKEFENKILERNGKKVLEKIYEIKNIAKRELGEDPETIIVTTRYNFIHGIIKDVIAYGKVVIPSITLSLDKILTHPILGLPIIVLLLFSTFFIIFSINTGFPLNIIFKDLGYENIAEAIEENSLSSILSKIFEFLSIVIRDVLNRINLPDYIISFICDGIIIGIGSVLSFFPLILITYIIFGIIEDSGLMARIAVASDTILRKIGLSGKAIMPLILGFGCNVPAVLGTRILEDDREKILAIMLAPIIPCQARLTVLLAIVAAIVKNPLQQANILISLYIISLIILVVMGKALKILLFKKYRTPELLIELPPYHRPSFRVISWLSWDRGIHFIKKAGTTIFLLSIIIWFMLNFGLSGYGVELSNSYAAIISKSLIPIGSLMGLDDWRLILALLNGFVAKEAVIETLTLASGATNPTDAINIIGISYIQALVLMTVMMIYTPCMPTLITVFSESRKLKYMIIVLIYQLSLAFTIGIIVFNLYKILFT